MMRCLVDTNIFIFLLKDEGMLSKRVECILEDYSNELYISSESVRELIFMVKANKGGRPKQLKSPETVIDYIENETRFVIKYVKKEHFVTFSKLPWFADHRDQRDRMIIAHAMTEKLTLISSDTLFYKYSDYGLDFIYNEKR